MKILKKMFYCFTLLLLGGTILAQNVPQAISYQAVARSENGVPIANKEIVIEISLRKTSSNGILEYREIHNPTTNEFGLFNVEIGTGENTFSGLVNVFSEINWLSEVYFLQVRADFGTGATINGLIDMGTTKLLSVPFTFVADRAAVADSLSKPPTINLTELSDVNISSPSDKQLVGWNAVTQKWIAADPTGDPGVFVRTDGTIDLINDWTISANNLTLTNGTVTAQTFLLNSGTSVNEFSTDVTLSDNSDNTVPTERAVKTYIDTEIASTPWRSNTNFIYNTDNKNVGVGNSMPDHKLQVDLMAGEGILFKGAHGSNVPDLGSGTRMTFYPGKASFRAGRIETQSDYWNDVNVGNYSAGFGHDTKASGDYSFVSGDNNQVDGNYSTSFGRNNQVSMPYSFASGMGNSVANSYSASFGSNNSSGGPYSFTSGLGNSVISTYGFAVGHYNYPINNALLMVGNGISSNRSNIFVILDDNRTGIGTGNSLPTCLFQVGTNGDGSVAIANNWSNFSDERLKKNLSKIENSIAKIKKLNGYYFFWKEGKDKSKQVGVIAQEVEKVLPEIVSTENNGYKSVDYSKLTALLIEVAKKQQDLIESLTKKNTELELANSDLKKTVESNLKRIENIEKYIKAEANIDMNKK